AATRSLARGACRLARGARDLTGAGASRSTGGATCAAFAAGSGVRTSRPSGGAVRAAFRADGAVCAALSRDGAVRPSSRSDQTRGTRRIVGAHFALAGPDHAGAQTQSSDAA